MADIVCKTVYFDKPGPKNTKEALILARERADALGIKNIIVASTTGETGAKASQIFKDYNLTVVTHTTGFTGPNVQELHPNNRKTIENNGVTILTTTHAFGTLGRAVNKKFATIQVDGIVSAVFRLFGQGMKVACEIACMTTDAGLIKTYEKAISIGGTRTGADTAVVLKPSTTHAFFDLVISELICKPTL